ncbi:MAG: winged helix DNA-binding domain-containing protein [Thermoflexales bacterium]|nr:winged helix DNA-binding domain-containing protein [Thermoflexales bacterium]
MDFLAHFYALSDNYGDYEHDYLEEYRAGRLSAEGKAIYEAILKNGALDAVRLRRESRMSADSAKGRFDRALTELQKGLKVLPTGIAEVGAWRYAFIYELLPRWLPDIPEKAREIGLGQARQAILDQYLRNVIAATPQQAARVFGWTLKQARQAAETLADEGRLRLDVKVEGLDGLQMITVVA